MRNPIPRCPRIARYQARPRAARVKTPTRKRHAKTIVVIHIEVCPAFPVVVATNPSTTINANKIIQPSIYRFLEEVSLCP